MGDIRCTVLGTKSLCFSPNTISLYFYPGTDSSYSPPPRIYILYSPLPSTDILYFPPSIISLYFYPSRQLIFSPVYTFYIFSSTDILYFLPSTDIVYFLLRTDSLYFAFCRPKCRPVQTKKVWLQKIISWREAPKIFWTLLNPGANTCEILGENLIQILLSPFRREAPENFWLRESLIKKIWLTPPPPPKFINCLTNFEPHKFQPRKCGGGGGLTVNLNRLVLLKIKLSPAL